MTSLRKSIKRREMVCYYCPDIATTLDHYVPKALGGTAVVPACMPCNRAKADIDPLGLTHEELCAIIQARIERRPWIFRPPIACALP